MNDRPAGLEGKLTCYTPGDQPMHEHAHSHLSLVLLGELQERSSSWDVDVARPMVCFKHAGTRHRNRWGPNGALIFSVRLDGRWHEGEEPPSGWWVSPHLATLKELVSKYLREREATKKLQYLFDFVSLSMVTTVPTKRPPTGPLKGARIRLREDPEGTRIADLAAEFGLHRVLFTRHFTDYFGTPPSIYRSRCKAMKAVAAAVATKQTLVSAAQAGGFFDQSHATRVVKREIHLRLGEVRRFAEVH